MFCPCSNLFIFQDSEPFQVFAAPSQTDDASIIVDIWKLLQAISE